MKQAWDGSLRARAGTRPHGGLRRLQKAAERWTKRFWPARGTSATLRHSLNAAGMSGVPPVIFYAQIVFSGPALPAAPPKRRRHEIIAVLPKGQASGYASLLLSQVMSPEMGRGPLGALKFFKGSKPASSLRG
jgi:hypothetical protein